MRDYKNELSIDRHYTAFIAQAKHVYRKFPLDGRQIAGANITLEGDNIMNFLKNSREIIMFAATLGFEADRQIAAAGKISVAAAYELDTCANRAINQICNYLQAQIATNHKITDYRFSCGYGDFPLSFQPKILKALDAKKSIGLYCNENNLLIPTKSVTAFIGVLH